MNMPSNYKHTATAVLLLTVLVGSSALMAQQTPNARNLPRPSNDIASCQDVEWNRSLLTNNPWVMNSCHEVIIVEGEKWARFEAEFEGMNRDGTFDVDILSRRGRSQGVVTMRPGAGQKVLLDNREFTFSELSDNQRLNFYVPEGAYGFAIEPGAAPADLVEVVKPRMPAAEPARLARAETRPARRTTILPATAGPLPLFALGGLLSVLGGIAMTMRRRSARDSN